MSTISTEAPVLQVVRIPCNETSAWYPLGLTSVPLLKLGTPETSERPFNEVEKGLNYIPDLGHYVRIQDGTFSSVFRSLAVLTVMDEGGDGVTPVAVYQMYLCLSEKSGLPHNKNLEDLTNVSRVRAYGDVFVFKMQPNVFDEMKHGEYMHMDELFVESVKKWGHARRYLQDLLKSTNE